MGPCPCPPPAQPTARSEDFRTAHAQRPPKEMFAGPNVFEMHEVIQSAGR